MRASDPTRFTQPARPAIVSLATEIEHHAEHLSPIKRSFQAERP
jgi:hypothetical protein